MCVCVCVYVSVRMPAIGSQNKLTTVMKILQGLKKGLIYYLLLNFICKKQIFKALLGQNHP